MNLLARSEVSPFQCKSESASFSQTAFTLDRSAMGFHNRLDDGESKAGAGLGSLVGYAEKLLENPWEILARNSSSRVRKRELDPFFICFPQDSYFSAGRGISESVREQVGKDMVHPCRIRPNFGQIILKLHPKRHVPILHIHLERFKGFKNHRMGRDFSEIHFNFPRLDSADIEQVIEDAMQPVAILPCCHQTLRLLRCETSYFLFQKQMDCHANGCKRALQLMRNG